MARYTRANKENVADPQVPEKLADWGHPLYGPRDHCRPLHCTRQLFDNWRILLTITNIFTYFVSFGA